MPVAKKKRLQIEPVSKKRRREDDNTLCINQLQKRVHLSTISCETGHPKRVGRPPKHPCRICGYACATKSNSVTFMLCCQRFCHKDCWKAQNRTTTEVNCELIATFLKKDRRTRDTDVRTSDRRAENPLDGLTCDLCNDIVKNEPDEKGTPHSLRGHYMQKCKEIPSTPLRKGQNERQTMRRIAALGLIKRVGKSDTLIRTRMTSTIRPNTTTHKFSPPQSVPDSESHPTVVADDS